MDLTYLLISSFGVVRVIVCLIAFFILLAKAKGKAKALVIASGVFMLVNFISYLYQFRGVTEYTSLVSTVQYIARNTGLILLSIGFIVFIREKDKLFSNQGMDPTESGS